MKESISIKTFGCKVNHYDSLLIKQQIQGLNLPEKKEIVILNSCAVTAEAGKNIRKQAKKIKKSNPNCLIVVTGCGAQVETNLYEQTESIDLVVANSHKQNLKNILQNISSKNGQKVFKSNIFKTPDIYSGFVSPDSERTRAFLKIQDGCDSFCTFCIIPFARGRSKSLSPETLGIAIQKLEDENVKEVVLTGVHIGDYRFGDTKLEDLLLYLLKHTKIPRIRLSSLEPVEITDKLLSCYQDARMCPHFHISLQSASSSVLKAMKRKYERKDVETAFQKITNTLPEAFIGMDVIAGFPSESHEDFEETYEVLKDQQWTNIHVFPYSSREGTFASRYTNLDRSEIVRRAALLRHLSDARFKNQIQKQIGTHKKVLVFKTDNTKGLSRDYWKVKIPPSSQTGEQDIFIKDIDPTKGLLKGIPVINQ